MENLNKKNQLDFSSFCNYEDCSHSEIDGLKPMIFIRYETDYDYHCSRSYIVAGCLECGDFQVVYPYFRNEDLIGYNNNWKEEYIDLAPMHKLIMISKKYREIQENGELTTLEIIDKLKQLYECPEKKLIRKS